MTKAELARLAERVTGAAQATQAGAAFRARGATQVAREMRWRGRFGGRPRGAG